MLMFKFVDNDDGEDEDGLAQGEKIGMAYINLPKIMSAEAQTFSAPLFVDENQRKQHGMVIVRAENVKESNRRCSFRIRTVNMRAKSPALFGLVSLGGPTYIEMQRA